MFVYHFDDGMTLVSGETRVDNDILLATMKNSCKLKNGFRFWFHDALGPSAHFYAVEKDAETLARVGALLSSNKVQVCDIKDVLKSGRPGQVTVKKGSIVKVRMSRNNHDPIRTRKSSDSYQIQQSLSTVDYK